jgi:hypothetical protein
MNQMGEPLNNKSHQLSHHYPQYAVELKTQSFSFFKYLIIIDILTVPAHVI